jgi:Zn-dependent M28 family amino/carboxypeptidase
VAAPLRAQDRIAAIRQAALGDDTAWSIVEGLTTEVGPRPAGSEAEARARDWAVARLKALGFANVHIEPFEIANGWVRGEERAEILAPFPQPLVLTALGGSGATPGDGLTGEIVPFATLDALRAADPAAIRGKIVYLGNQMAVARDGSNYGAFTGFRRRGPSVAAQKGAVAILIRSIGTDHHRVAHAGQTNWADGVSPIPAAALTVPDAEQIERIVARGKPVTVRLRLTPRRVGRQESGNVVAELPGRDPALPIIVIGGHLDSWDFGTGAIDDGAGVAITTAAAKQVMAAGKPLRTIRLVWFGAEEPGGLGGEAYGAAHSAERPGLVSEADFGSDRVWRFMATTAPAGKAVIDRITAALQPLDVAWGGEIAQAGSDVWTMVERGAARFALGQDGTRYFDIHHTADDTLDKVDPAQLRQAVAAWTMVLAIAANSPVEFGPVTPSRSAAH